MSTRKARAMQSSPYSRARLFSSRVVYQYRNNIISAINVYYYSRSVDCKSVVYYSKSTLFSSVAGKEP